MTSAHTFICLCLAFAVVSSQSDFTSSYYQAQSRQAKLNQLWNQCIADTRSVPFPSVADMSGLFTESMKPSVDYVSDSMPEDRIKYVHSVGTVFTCAFEATADSPYTGFFQGADSIVSRFSTAKEPNYSDTAASAAEDNFVPAVAFKFLINGQASANIFAMYSVNGVKTFNLFDQDFLTHIPDASGFAATMVANKFSSGTNIVQVMGTRKASEFTQDGKAVASAKYPWKVIFRPKANVKSLFTSDYTEDYSVTLSRIPAGTAIFDVYAVDTPTQSCEKLIGTIKSTSEFTTSTFGDNQLFFQHPDFHYDLSPHPEWKDYTPVWNTIGSKSAKKQEGKCPFFSM